MHEILGARVRDIITGFGGVAIGRVEYISGCNQVLVQPRAKNDGGFVEAAWFDEQRLSTEELQFVRLENGDTPGFDKPAPVR